MEDKLQRLTFSGYLINGEVQNYHNPVSGVFHQWGNDVIKLDKQWYPITVAIVESDGGKIFNATPETVTFIK